MRGSNSVVVCVVCRKLNEKKSEERKVVVALAGVGMCVEWESRKNKKKYPYQLFLSWTE
jgi:hypothetical protein